MAADFTTMPPEANNLIIQIMQANANQSASITNNLIDSLTEQAADSRAEVDAIRAHILDLLSGPYMATPEAIERALWPSAEVRAAYREGDAE